MNETGDTKNIGAKVLRATFVVTIASGLGYLISFAKGTMVAAYLGVGREMDVFLWVLAVVTMFAEFVSTPLPAVLVPVYLSLKVEDEKLSRQYLGAIQGFLLITSIVLTGILFLFSTWLTRFLGGNIHADGTKLAVHLIWLMLPLVFFSVLWTSCEAILIAQKSFFLPTFANSIPALSVIAILLIWGKKSAVFSQAIGISIGAGLQFGILAFVLWRKKSLGVLSLNWHQKGVSKTWKLLWPLIVTQAFLLSLPIIDRTMAAKYSSGTISALGYAQILMSMSAMILLSAIYSAVLPFFSEQTSSGDYKAFKKTFTSAIRIVVIFLLPVTTILIALQKPIIRLVFQRGAFDAFATSLTAPAFALYMLGVVPMAITFISSRGFNALLDSKTNALVGTGLFFTVKIMGNLLFSRLWGYLGLALATSVAYTVTAAVMLWIMRYKLGGIGTRYLAVTSIKVGIASLAAGWLAWWGIMLGRERLGLQLGFGSALALLGFGLVVALLKIEDFHHLVILIWGFIVKNTNSIRIGAVK